MKKITQNDVWIPVIVGSVIGIIMAAVALINFQRTVSPIIVEAPEVKNPVGAPLPFEKFNVSKYVLIGKDIPTEVATSSPTRAYLEITNLSGATSTTLANQPIFCSTSSTVAPYTGFVVYASTTGKVFTRENGVPTGRVYCVAPTATTAAAVVDR